MSDIFREPKPAAGFYKSQCDPAEQVVLEPAFHWARGDESVGFSRAVDKLVAEADPDRAQFAHLRHPPFDVKLGELFHRWGDLRIEGYIGGKQVIAKSYSGKGVDARFALLPDDTQLLAEGADSTRVVLRVTDEFGAIRPFANDAIKLELEGPAEIVGDSPFALVGGTGAVWIRAKEQAGKVKLRGTHPQLGTQETLVDVVAAPPEAV